MTIQIGISLQRKRLSSVIWMLISRIIAVCPTKATPIIGSSALIRREGRALLCHRSPLRDWYPDLWNLPGGHVGEDETAAQGVARELWEELGMRIEPPLFNPFAHVQGADFRMDVWLIEEWIGEPSNTAPGEHDALAWVNPAEALDLELADERLPALIEAALT
jgi:8-oxo-dGTP diphosphatase